MPPAKATPNGASAPPSRRIAASSTTLCEILPGTGTAPLSEVLDLLDLAAGRTAFRHVGGTTVTASFEDVRLTSRIPRGALVRASARVISVGRSSVLLRVQAEAEDVALRKFRRCVTAYATFVALGEREGAARARARVPAIAPEDAQEAEGGARVKERLRRARAQVARIACADARSLSVDRACCGPSDASETVVARAAEVAFQKQYLPRHENFAGVVFGGDLLETMGRVATYCGRRFARGRGRAQCVGIRFFNFMRPIEAMNLLCVRARVAGVRGCVVYVEVGAAVDEAHDGVGLVAANEGLFAVQLTDEGGRPVECGVGLAVEGEGVEAVRAHRKAVEWIGEESLQAEVPGGEGGGDELLSMEGI